MKFVDFIHEQDETLTSLSQEDFTKEDILEILNELNQEEINEVAEFIMDLIYDPSFDEEDLDESDKSDKSDESDNLNEVKYFKTKKSQLNRQRKRDKTALRKAAKERKKYYKKNKAKLRRKNKLYRKKVKRQPNKVQKHRK